MIVVSDTSPLNYLVLIDAIDLLPALFETVYVPTAVITELSHPKAPPAVARWVKSPPDWLLVVQPSFPLALVPPNLGPGEIGAISIAKEFSATTLLIDEWSGTRFAREQGLNTVGTLAVLELAAARNILDLPEAIRRLQQTTFRISTALLTEALSRDAARKTRQ